MRTCFGICGPPDIVICTNCPDNETNVGKIMLHTLPSLSRTPIAAAQPRAIGAVRLEVGWARGGSRISRLRQSGSLKLLFPRAAGSRAGLSGKHWHTGRGSGSP